MGKSTISMAIFNCYVSSPEDNHDIPSVAASTLISPWWLSRSTKRERSATPKGPRSQVRFLGCPTERGDSSCRSHRVTQVRPPGPPRRTECTGCHQHPVSLGSLAPQKNGPKQGRSCGWKSDINKEKLGWMPFYQTLWLLYDVFSAISGTKRLATTDSSPSVHFGPWKAGGSWMATAAPITQKKTTSLERCQRWYPEASQCHRSAFPCDEATNFQKKKVGFPKWIQMVD